jgi:hypothetical protein
MSICLSLVILSGCNSSINEENAQQTEVPAIVEVEIQPSNDNPSTGEDVVFNAIVTQAGEAVEDASDVSFEIWEKESGDHEMIVGEHVGDGTYSTHKKFETEGIYYIVAHITARDQHTMPRIELMVGNPTKLKEEAAHDHSSTEHSHGEGNLTVEVKLPEQLYINETISVEAMIIHEEMPLTKAQVKFEFWGEHDTRHEFIEAKEKLDGHYVSSYEFKEAGKKFIVVHVQNNELHEHIQHEIDIR